MEEEEEDPADEDEESGRVWGQRGEACQRLVGEWLAPNR